MPVKTLIFIFIILIPGFTIALAQRNADKLSCTCPKNNVSTDKKPAAVFRLTNGIAIGLTGYKETDPAKKPISYQEFAISQCGKTELISVYGADQYCRIRTKKDTLYIDEYEFSPTDQRFNSRWSLWQMEKIYVRKRL